jgi:hypothetical protein
MAAVIEPQTLIADCTASTWGFKTPQNCVTSIVQAKQLFLLKAH